MEKYCPKCGRVLGDVDFKLCPYCGTKLKKRAGRQPIHSYLRHEVFKRDNYRCVECGATNKETTLEIDHIIPVAKGGTNDIKNLQTLCKECNRAKNATFWNEKDLELKIELNENQIRKLETQNKEYKKLKKSSLSEEEVIEVDYQILTNKERIQELKEELKSLKAIKKENRKNKEKRAKEDLLYKELYVKDDSVLEYLFSELSVSEDLTNKRDKIRYLVEHYDEIEIYEAIIENPSDVKLYNKLYAKDPIVLEFLFSEFSISTYLSTKEEKIRYLAEYYDESKIEEEAIKTPQKVLLYHELCEEKVLVLEYLFREFSVPKTLKSKKKKLKFLVNNYDVRQIKRGIKEYYGLKSFLNELNSKEDSFLEYLFKELSIPVNLRSRKQKLKFIVENYDKKTIDKVIKKRDKELKFFEKLYIKDSVLEYLFREFSVPKKYVKKKDKFDFLVNNHNAKEIDAAVKKYQREKKEKEKALRKENEKRRNLLVSYVEKLSIEEYFKFFIIDEINQEKIHSEDEINEIILNDSQ